MPDRVAISTECAADSRTLRSFGWIMPDARDPRKPATLTGSCTRLRQNAVSENGSFAIGGR